MNRSNGPVIDLEAATDQLVDEICQRIASLYALLDTSLADRGPAPENIRIHAGEHIDRMSGARGPTTAAALARTLWPPRPGEQIPASWWSTPLGRLILTAAPHLDSHQRDQRPVDHDQM